MLVCYYLARKLLFREAGEESPRVGDELCFDGRHYSVARVVRHIPMCPPDWVNVYLVMAPTEVEWPVG